MKRICTWLVCICALWVLSGADAFAQYDQTKCPPKQKSWKVRKSLIKFPELVEQEKAKESKKKDRMAAKAPKPAPVKLATVKEKEDRQPRYKKQRTPKAKLQKLNSREVASTKCPR